MEGDYFPPYSLFPTDEKLQLYRIFRINVKIIAIDCFTSSDLYSIEQSFYVYRVSSYTLNIPLVGKKFHSGIFFSRTSTFLI